LAKEDFNPKDKTMNYKIVGVIVGIIVIASVVLVLWHRAKADCSDLRKPTSPAPVVPIPVDPIAASDLNRIYGGTLQNVNDQSNDVVKIADYVTITTRVPSGIRALNGNRYLDFFTIFGRQPDPDATFFYLLEYTTPDVFWLYDYTFYVSEPSRKQISIVSKLPHILYKFTENDGPPAPNEFTTNTLGSVTNQVNFNLSSDPSTINTSSGGKYFFDAVPTTNHEDKRVSFGSPGSFTAGFTEAWDGNITPSGYTGPFYMNVYTYDVSSFSDTDYICIMQAPAASVNEQIIVGP
jgi:hypothetical protein